MIYPFPLHVDTLSCSSRIKATSGILECSPQEDSVGSSTTFKTQYRSLPIVWTKSTPTIWIGSSKFTRQSRFHQNTWTRHDHHWNSCLKRLAQDKHTSLNAAPSMTAGWPKSQKATGLNRWTWVDCCVSNVRNTSRPPKNSAPLYERTLFWPASLCLCSGKDFRKCLDEPAFHHFLVPCLIDRLHFIADTLSYVNSLERVSPSALSTLSKWVTSHPLMSTMIALGCILKASAFNHPPL
jgi:hypothetical protein